MFPAPNATMHSRGTQRFRADGRHAAQTTAGTIVGGTGRYRHARGTLTGFGTVMDTATRLSNVRLAYRLVMRVTA